MSTQTRNTSAQAELQQLLNAWLKAVQSMDADAIMTFYAPDVIAFDAIGKLQFKGKQEYGEHWRQCMTMCPGPMVFELHQTAFTVDGGLGVCHALIRCGAADENGEEKTSWMRMTTVYQRGNGTWRIAHEHYSAPFDPQSGNACFDLQPA